VFYSTVTKLKQKGISDLAGEFLYTKYIKKGPSLSFQVTRSDEYGNICLVGLWADEQWLIKHNSLYLVR
jgi:hypothetical protein